MRRVSEHDVVMLALLYNKLNDGYSYLLADKVKLYDLIVNKKLEDINSHTVDNYKDADFENEYIYYEDNDGEYYTLNPEMNLDKAIEDYFDLMPEEILKVSSEEDALNAIGLTIVDGKITRIKHKLK